MLVGYGVDLGLWIYPYRISGFTQHEKLPCSGQGTSAVHLRASYVDIGTATAAGFVARGSPESSVAVRLEPVRIVVSALRRAALACQLLRVSPAYTYNCQVQLTLVDLLVIFFSARAKPIFFTSLDNIYVVM